MANSVGHLLLLLFLLASTETTSAVRKPRPYVSPGWPLSTAAMTSAGYVVQMLSNLLIHNPKGNEIVVNGVREAFAEWIGDGEFIVHVTYTFTQHYNQGQQLANPPRGFIAQGLFFARDLSFKLQGVIRESLEEKIIEASSN
ncbi:hypothetical protein AXF42_Ash021476 [Apostasia shenzhenica]|uniref:Uncharacterized protein n=1 Tax=Apostasia shenzhenica TaxID=1088818 RepID=A0A2H9ZYD6_9ASPA|nr:hypothetical protein AXF42_Ash021476 [Apostasia shenzhenica]